MCRAVSPQGRTPSSHWSSEGPWGAWFQLPQATVPWEVGSSLYGRERLLPKIKWLWGFPKIAGGGGGDSGASKGNCFPAPYTEF